MNESSKQHTIPLVLDSFCAGGTGLGFVQAGFRIVGAIEHNVSAAMTYERNLNVRVKQADIREINPILFRQELNLEIKQLDVLVGCPPCQGFTRLRNQNGHNDKRNDLVLLYLEFVKEFQPTFALFENVPGLTRTVHGSIFYEALCKGLQKLGYGVSTQELDAANFGVPQRRRRIIVIGGRDNVLPKFPTPTHAHPKSKDVQTGHLNPWITVRDVIGNDQYPRLLAGQDGQTEGKFLNHVASKTGEKVLNFISRVPHNGGSRMDLPEDTWLACHRNHKGHNDVYGRLSWDEPSGTMTSGCTNPSKGRFVHPEQDRALTPREAAKLQGFPDSFVFFGTTIASQIGNAVPPPFAKALANALL